jgi:2,5-diketo-D-gluconate reductase B
MARDELPDIGLGTYGNVDPVDCVHSIETALNLGYRHVDTAEGYNNESAVGEGIEAADVDREDVLVATKVSPSNLGFRDAVEHARASRERLCVDVIDLLYVHWPIGAYDPGETLPAFDDLRDDDVVRHVGLSNFTPELLDEALERLEAPLFGHQVECHPLFQQAELRAHAREHGYQLVAYSPLAKGDVTDVPELVAVAEKHDATSAQVALAWLRSKENVVAIPKAASEAHIRENLAARELALDEADLERIDAIDREERYVDHHDAPWK